MKVSDQLRAPIALSPGKGFCYRLDRKLCGHRSRSGRSGEREGSLLLSGIEPRSSRPYPVSISLSFLGCQSLLALEPTYSDT